MIQFRKITEENFVKILDMEQAEGQKFVPPNVESLAQAWLYYENHDVYSFAIYDGETPVGFMQLEIELGCKPENTGAMHIYEKLGFRPAGEVEEGELPMRLDF